MCWARRANPCVTLKNPAHLANAHAASTQKWGWVLEMYGFTIACYKAAIQPARLHIKMMSQPPWDTKVWPYYLLHYTYGASSGLSQSLHTLVSKPAAAFVVS